MSYSPNNLTVYTAAYAGAFAGFVASARVLVDADSASYADPATIIGAFSQALDQAWEAGPNVAPDTLQVLCLQNASKAVFESRNSPLTRQSDNPLSYLILAEAIVAALVAAESYVTGQGITPDAWPSGGGGGIAAVTGVTPGISVFTSGSTAQITANTILISSNPSVNGPSGNQPLTTDQAILLETNGSTLAPPEPSGYHVDVTLQCEYTGGGAGAEAVFQIFRDDNSVLAPLVQFSQWIAAGGISTVTWAGFVNIGTDPSTAIFAGVSGAGTNVTVLANDGIGNPACHVSITCFQGFG